MTLLILAFFGAYFHLLAQRRSRWQIVFLAVLFAAVFPGSIQRNHKEMEGIAAGRRAWKQCYLKTESVPACNASTNVEIYLPKQERELQRKLQYLKQNRLNLYATGNWTAFTIGEDTEADHGDIARIAITMSAPTPE